MILIVKQCRRCKKDKFFDEFYKLASSSDGLRSYCKICTVAANTASRTRDHGRRYELKRDFGITLEQYQIMEESQQHRCAVCKEPETIEYAPGKISRLCVDHDHDTGRIRGLLCKRCNRAIGLLRDDPSRLRTAADYLEWGTP